MRAAMDKRSSRLFQLIEYILSNEVVHYKDLMPYMKLSRKSISKYLDMVSNRVKNWGVTLERKPNVGIYFKGNVDQLQFHLAHDNLSQSVFTTEQRRLSIIAQLLMKDKGIKLQDLADHFFVSRGTIDTDIKSVKRYLSKYRVKVTSNREGILVDASERMRRKIMSKLISAYWGQTVDQHDKTGKMIRTFQIPNSIQKYVDPKILKEVQRILKEFVNMAQLELTDYEYQSLLIHIVIGLERVKEDKVIDQVNGQQNIEKNTTLLIHLIEQDFEIHVPDYEKEYLNVHVLAIQQGSLSLNSKMINSNVEKNNQLLDSFLKTHLLGFDNELMQGLILHIKPALKRFVLGLGIYNPYTAEIKRYFPQAFDQALNLTIALGKNFGVQISEDETAFIALHIEAYLERIGKTGKITAVIVCSTGLGTARLLNQRIQQLISNLLQIKRILSIHELEKTKITEDLVISTIPIHIANVPIVVVNPFFDNQSVHLVKNKIGEIKRLKLNSTSFMKLINTKFIFTRQCHKTSDEVIRFIGKQLCKNGYAELGIVPSALNREKLASTAMNHIALPHADIKYVNKPVIAVYINPVGIRWGDDIVYVVFFIALNKGVSQDIDQIYRYFNELLRNSTLIHKRRKTANSIEVIQLLEGGED